MIFRDRKKRGQAGEVTVIELLEAIAAIVLAAWLAPFVSSYFDGTWRVIVRWSILTVGSGILFFCFACGFSYVLDYFDRRKIEKKPDGKDRQNTA